MLKPSIEKLLSKPQPTGSILRHSQLRENQDIFNQFSGDSLAISVAWHRQKIIQLLADHSLDQTSEYRPRARVRKRSIGFWVSMAAAFGSWTLWCLLMVTRTVDLSLLPTTAAVWGNYIIFSPLAEELLFRRVAVDYFSDRHGRVLGILASAVLFSLIQLPWWILSAEQTGQQLSEMSITLFVYGLAFGILYRATGSIWASLIPHVGNNLASAVFV